MSSNEIATDRTLLEITPRVCLHDVHSTIRATGLPPNTSVTFKATLSDQKGIPYISHAFYKSDDSGIIDLDRDQSLGGSYQGVFPSGLLSSLIPAPGQFKYHRLVSKDTSKPWHVKITIHEGQEGLEEWSSPLDIAVMERHIAGPGVRRIPVREGRIRGVLYLPPGKGPFPGVIDLFGGVGGCVEHRSAMLATRGIASFSLAYFRYEDLPKTYNNLELEYLQEAVDYLLSVPEVISSKCGVIGICLGGLLAIIMAIYCDKVKYIVTINAGAGTDIVLTYKGKPTHKPWDGGIAKYMTFDEQMRVVPMKDAMKEALQNNPHKALPVYKIDDSKQIIFVGGGDDSMIGDVSARVMDQIMKNHGKTNSKCIVFPDAGHMLEPPYGPLIEHSYQVNPEGKDGTESSTHVMYWGGKLQANSKAQEELWKIMQSFFKDNIQTEAMAQQTKTQFLTSKL